MIYPNLIITRRPANWLVGPGFDSRGISRSTKMFHPSGVDKLVAVQSIVLAAVSQSKPVTPRRRCSTSTDASAVMAAHRRLSSATCRNDDVEHCRCKFVRFNDSWHVMSAAGGRCYCLLVSCSCTS